VIDGGGRAPLTVVNDALAMVVLGSMRKQAERSCHLDRVIAGVNFSMLVIFFFFFFTHYSFYLPFYTDDSKPVSSTPPRSPVSRFLPCFPSCPDFQP
jgi:hypothetical protein